MPGLRFLLPLFFIGIPLFGVEEGISEYYKNGMDAYNIERFPPLHQIKVCQ
jgi:hypothetical protein